MVTMSGGSDGLHLGRRWSAGGPVGVAERLLGTVIWLCVAGCVVVFAGEPADAAVSHQFLPVVSGVLSKGVPVETTPEEALLKGELGTVNALTVDSGHLWIAERLAVGGSRVDKFDAATGAFSPPQLDEGEGVSELHEGGVAVGHSSGEEVVYVGAGQEGKGNVVAVFDPAGKLLHTWTGENTPNKSFTRNAEGEGVGVLTGIAVDGSASFETSGDVYVATSTAFGIPSFNVVDVLKPAAGNEEPAKVTAQLTGTCSTPGTTCSGGEVVPFSRPSGLAVSGVSGDVLVTDGEKVVDMFEPALGEYRFLRQLTGTPTGAGGKEQPFEEVAAVAVDGGDGDVYVADAGRHVVDEFSEAGKYLGRLTGTPAGPFHSLKSVAADAVSHQVYVGDFNEEKQVGAIDVFGAGVVVPDVTTAAPGSVKVTGEGGIVATLAGTVNPDGEGEASCSFVWGTTRAFGRVAPCEPKGVAEGESPVPVQTTVTGLAPDTSYFYRLQASNKNGTNPGEEFQDEELVTPGPGLHGESASEVAATAATLEATIDPHGAQTSYYFEYGKSSEYEAQAPAAPGASLGSGEGDVEVKPRHVQGLAPGTVYHYRVVAVSELEVEGVVKRVAFAGPDQTFTTQGVGGGPLLADGRGWELVSPPDKHGALIEPIAEDGVIQASASGGAIAYLGTVPTEEHAKGNFEGVQIISTREVPGWSSQDIALAHATSAGVSTGYGREYRAFSPDLAIAMVEPLGEYTSRAPEVWPPDTERTPYLRHNTTCASMPERCFEPLVTGAQGYADVPEGTKFGGFPELGAANFIHGEANFVGGSPDLAHAIVSSGVALTGATTSGREELYEWSAARPPTEALQLVSLLPGNAEAAHNAAQLGFGDQIARHAVSDDGSRIVWSELEGHLYMRDTAKGQTVQLDVAQGVSPSGTPAPQFQIASRDGSKVFFTDTQRLTEGSRASQGQPGRPDLYECEMVEVAGELQCRLSDLTPGSGEEAADVQGAVLGASEDGSWVYYVANGVLGEHATPGNCNESAPPVGATCHLYVSHFNGASWQAPRLVATLSGKDWPDWAGGGETLGKLTARVSPDGRWLAFMSQLGLTGYDTRDAVSGLPAEEVYLYDASGNGGVGRVVCASCNPTGARPVGVEYKKLNDKLVGGDRVWSESQTIAANIPGWTPYRVSKALYQSRYLSDEGRLFFNSRDALVAQDINNNQDVYEFEPAGVGSCSPSSSTYIGASAGCVGLISSGRAAGESAFMDASENGNDVFFLTAERLAGQDLDTALDLYDAHVCSTNAPCLTSAVVPPACTTADACRGNPTPQPQITSSASAMLSGAGNIPPPPKSVVVLTQAQRLKKALGTCRAKYKKSKKRRATCERQARRRYGARQARKANAKKRGNR